jgi:hypothetical protein
MELGDAGRADAKEGGDEEPKVARLRQGYKQEALVQEGDRDQ